MQITMGLHLWLDNRFTFLMAVRRSRQRLSRAINHWFTYISRTAWNPYTDYEKLFSYSKTVVTQKESDQEVVEGAGVSDVQHWVKYTF